MDFLHRIIFTTTEIKRRNSDTAKRIVCTSSGLTPHALDKITVIVAPNRTILILVYLLFNQSHKTFIFLPHHLFFSNEGIYHRD